ncbi:glycosyltransferase family 2 protein, partial [Rhizobiaceae sp. 2RAB30]
MTIVVPLFCEERFVADALLSLKRQTVTNFEVVVVDDASLDRSAIVALKAIDGDRRFRLVRHLRNSGLSASRNTG